MIIVRKRRGKLVVFILIAANVILVCLSVFILFWPTHASSAKGARKTVESRTDTSPHTHIAAPATTTAPGENEAFLAMRVTQVYAHNTSRLYYPEDCPHRPEKRQGTSGDDDPTVLLPR